MERKQKQIHRNKTYVMSVRLEWQELYNTRKIYIFSISLLPPLKNTSLGPVLISSSSHCPWWSFRKRWVVEDNIEHTIDVDSSTTLLTHQPPLSPHSGTRTDLTAIFEMPYLCIPWHALSKMSTSADILKDLILKTSPCYNPNTLRKI